MTTRRACSWCEQSNDMSESAAVYCSSCGHRADAPRLQCDCRSCADKARLFRMREKEQAEKGSER